MAPTDLPRALYGESRERIAREPGEPGGGTGEIMPLLRVLAKGWPNKNREEREKKKGERDARKEEFYAWIKLLTALLRRPVLIYQQAGPKPA